jgi:MFS superfamily sulfate permease-like transporter
LYHAIACNLVSSAHAVFVLAAGLAFALLCNMPAQYGLYTSLLPPFIYMILGTCTQISFGVTAIEALFVSACST